MASNMTCPSTAPRYGDLSAFSRQRRFLPGVPAIIALLLSAIAAAPLNAQEPSSGAPSGTPAAPQEQQPGSAGSTASPSNPRTAEKREDTSTTPALKKDSSSADDAEGTQTKRILWVIPNYRAVSANTQLPPQSVKQKFWLATQDSFDYSSFIFAGMLAGTSQAQASYPAFGQGARGYGRYYWHSMADQAVGNYFTEAILPSATREDPRYYTLGHGGFFRRTGYAVSRLLITRTDSGGRVFNFSEIVGNGAGAGVSDLYYPGRYRTWTKTGQKWLTQCALDGVFNAFKEFWPDISHYVFRQPR